MKPIWFPLAGLLWLGIAAYVLTHNWGWWRHHTMGFWFDLLMPMFFGVLFLGFLLAALLGGAYALSSIIGEGSEQVWRRSWHADLASMRNSDGIQGSVTGGVFIMSGRMESKEIYYYYTAEGNDTYKPHSWIPNHDTFVVEEERKDAEVFQSVSEFKNPLVDWFGTVNDRVKMEFHIPKGSLIHQYSIK